MYLATAGGGCAAICGGSPVKLPGFETSFEIFVQYLYSTSELSESHNWFFNPIFGIALKPLKCTILYKFSILFIFSLLSQKQY